MKILFITDLYPIKCCENSTPRTLHNFVFEWIKQGHSVDVIRPNFVFNAVLRGKKLYPKGFYEYEGVKIFNVNYFTPFLLNFLAKIPKEFGLKDYDVVIAHMPSGIIFANKLVKIIEKPLICGVHVSDIEVLTNPVYRFYFKQQLEEAYKNAKKIACRSFVLQEKFKKLMPELADKTFVAPSGVEINAVGLESPTYCPTIKVLTCANLIKRKNIDKLILAIKDLDDFELTIIGDGKEFKRLKSLVKEVGCGFNRTNIKFLGRLPHEKVLEQMQTADIFILPSVNETFGMVYLEAMASGCVTVCTKNDGIDGIIKDGENGFLTEPTVEGIKDTLLRIKTLGAAKPAPYNMKKIIENSLDIVKSYSPETCAEKYLKNLNMY